MERHFRRTSIELRRGPRSRCFVRAGLLWIFIPFLLSDYPARAETAPILSVADASIVEGDSGTTNLVFKLVLSRPASHAVMVDYATRDVTAVAGDDYFPAFGVAIFEPGSTSQCVLVSIRGDQLNEEDETFWLTLEHPVNATLSRTHAVGMILNDDPPPMISIGDSPIIPPFHGLTNAHFKINLSATSGQTITVDLLTSNGTARSGRDFVPVADTLTFTPGIVMQSVTVPVNRTSSTDSNQFFVILTNAVNATLARNTAVCTIKSDHPPVAASENVPVRPLQFDRLVPQSVDKTANPSVYPNPAPILSSPLPSPQPSPAVVQAPQPTPPPAELVLGNNASTNFIHVEQALVFLLHLTNRGPSNAQAVVVTDQLPAGATLLSVQISQGTYSVLQNNIICNFGDVPSGTEATATIQTRFGAPGLATNSAVVTASSVTTSAQAFTSIVVLATNDSPIISRIPDQITTPNTPTPVIAFTVSDTETAAKDLLVLGASSDKQLVPDENLIFGGQGRERSLIIVPAPDQSGVAVVTLSLFDTDGGLAEQSFNVNVVPERQTTLHLEREGESLVLGFEAEPDVSYVIEYCDSLAASWKTLTTVSPLPTRALVSVREIIGTQQERFYRLRVTP